jgi:N utilization substance protein A
MNKELVAIFEYLEREKGIKRDIIIAAIEESLKTAAYKTLHGLLDIAVQINPKTGDIAVSAQKEVVTAVTIPEEEILLDEAKVLHPLAEVGQWVEVPVTIQNLGRIAAQTARQVIGQKLRSAERDVIYEEYRHRVNEIVSGSVKRTIRGATLVVDLGKVEAILPDRFYPKTEKYNIGDRVQALLFEVRDTENGGAEVILSRSHPEFVAQLFSQEVPELADGTVVIERIVREAGYRTKLAVRSTDPKVDPVGACVGVRGTRVKNIIRELSSEKIDIVPFSEDSVQLLQNALAPIEIKKIRVSDDSSAISIVVDDESYPAALGKRGMNARLSGALIGAELHIQKMSDYQNLMAIEQQELASIDSPALDEPLAIPGMSHMILESFISAGYDTPRKMLTTPRAELAKIPGISVDIVDKLLDEVRKKVRSLQQEQSASSPLPVEEPRISPEEQQP